MARDIVKNLKFKKYDGNFDPIGFAKMLEDSYLATKRPDGDMQKYTFSPSSFGYGKGNCPRYWYMAFSGANFIDDNDAIAVANMAQGTQAHERLQKLIDNMGIVKHLELEITNDNPPIRGFADLILDWEGKEVIGEIKTAKQEVWDTRQSSMSPSANHLLQLLSYMKIRNVDEGFFLYENKNTQEVLIIPVQMTEKNKKIIDDLFVWLEEVYDNFNNGDLPVRPYAKTSTVCKYCPLKKECWSGNPGTVEINAYEVPKI